MVSKRIVKLLKGYVARGRRRRKRRIRTSVLGETDCERTLADLLLEQILLVQEQDYRGVREPFVVADRVEQLQRLLHSVLFYSYKNNKEMKHR